MLLRHVLGSFVLTLAFAADAQAQILVEPARDCPPETLEQPFASWGDRASYVLVPDGGFEGGAAGWGTARARVVEGGQPLARRTPEDAHALALSPGGTARSPAVCVGFGHPTIRFFARNTGSPLGVLAVSVAVTTALGPRLELPIGVMASLKRRWSPSLPMPLLVNLLAVTGGRTSVALRFTAVGPLSSWEIDDVYVDPFSRR